ncbi:polysaccharide deacetylase family protein [Algoriphagus halophytocola]|uniref:Polysaccharide deacetylase family protein n=1 Tax=Algoriphagus halophytocola TaxID=2991499 RepID=A0ABY6MLP3_9BACT|nr:polysaccharide deacetylase family protein [Algoriphagus sp. TR-M5]UZD23894.1 polysaccharide deacetylase family protein [Algoriphagus sp. TR-M5]
MTKANLIISLDFELHWGRFDKYALDENGKYYAQTLEALPRILDLFEKYNIRATWATVGMLMAESWEEWKAFSPEILPSFHQEKYSAFYWASKQSGKSKLGLFAPEMVNKILETPGQELASHTFSHFYTGEKGSTLEAFEADLQASKKIAQAKFGVAMQSLVFPRNQYHSQVMEVAAKTGFTSARVNPSDWFWKETSNENLLKKVFRTGDTLLPMGKPVSFDLKDCTAHPLFQVPASRLLRPYREGSVFNRRRIERIKSELEQVCEKGQSYHLWWHPHNFGNYPEENLRILEDLLIFIRSYVASGMLQSISMKDAYNLIAKNYSFSK